VSLKTWRRERREATYFDKAMKRSSSMREPEIVENVDLALLTAGQAISRYRNTLTDPQYKMDQLREVRISLEAALGMLDNVITQ
jgi:hypothetical protein